MTTMIEVNVDRFINSIDITHIPIQKKNLEEIKIRLKDPKTTPLELAMVVNKNIAITTKILKMANGPNYGLCKRVSSINFAIIVIGFDHIRDMVKSSFLHEQSITNKQKQYIRYSILMAEFAKKIAENNKLAKNDSDDLYNASLIHLIPLLVNGYENLKEEDLPTINNISAGLLTKWRFPARMVDMVRFIKDPYNEKNSTPLFSEILNIASFLASQELDIEEPWCIREVYNSGKVILLQEKDLEHLRFINDAMEKIEESF